jgi:hypothetical protein
MARRRKRDDDWIGLVVRLTGVVMLLSLISPQVRQAIFAVGFIAICLLAVAVVGLIGFGVYWLATRSKRSASSNHGYLSSITDANAPPVNLPRIEVPARTKGTAPQTTAELLEQLRSIDWFQFEKLVGLAYRNLGYQVTRRGGANPDGGIDLVIQKDDQRSAVQWKQ